MLDQAYTFESGRRIYDAWILNEFDSFSEFYKNYALVRFIFKDVFGISDAPEMIPSLDVWEDLGDALSND